MPDQPIGDIMSRAVLSVAIDTPLQQVAAEMSEMQFSCAVVCAPNGEPLGVISERDLSRAYARDVPTGESPRADSAMSQGLWTLTEDETCNKAIQTMSERGIRRLVIVDESNQLAGIVTQTDMLRVHARGVEQQKRLLEVKVAERTRELRELNVRLESLASLDPLMGIGNRRAMEEELTRLTQRAKRYRRPYSVALLDVDYFKKFNDHYGHGAGDEALREIASCIERTIRVTDAVYRYGGEELLIIFSETAHRGALTAAGHVCDAVAALGLPHELSPLGYLSVSIGVAEEDLDAPDWARTVARADEVLYIAKDSGRNRVVSHTDKCGTEVVAA